MSKQTSSNIEFVIQINMQLRCPSHPDQPLDLVCLSSSCQQRGLLCYLCSLELHSAHEPMVALKPFMHSFLNSKAAKVQTIREVAQIDQQFINIQENLTKMKRKCMDFDIIEDSFNKFWKSTINQVSNYDSIVKDLSDILRSDTDQLIKNLNSWVQKHSGLYQAEQEERQKENIFGNYLIQQLQKITNINTSVDKISEKGTFQDSDLLTLFQIDKTSFRKFKLHFSQELKGPCMTIHSPTKASMGTSGSQRMILLEPALNNNKTIKKWKVKIDKLASWIGVGISHLDSVKGANFDFSYTSAGHGNYLVSSNGYSWNGYKMQFNSKHQTFQYKTGDIIEITFDPIHSKVSFSKQSHDKTFTYEVDPNQKPLHASINMTGIGDCVQIIP